MVGCCCTVLAQMNQTMVNMNTTMSLTAIAKRLMMKWAIALALLTLSQWCTLTVMWWCGDVILAIYQKSLDFRLDSGSSWFDGVNSILMQQEPNSPKQDYWNRRAIASLANTLFTVVESVPTPLLSSMLLLQL
jgi:hypothetical protein